LNVKIAPHLKRVAAIRYFMKYCSHFLLTVASTILYCYWHMMLTMHFAELLYSACLSVHLLSLHFFVAPKSLLILDE